MRARPAAAHPRVRSTNLSRRSQIAFGESSTTRRAREPDCFRFPAFRVIRVFVLSARDPPVPSRLQGKGPSVGASPVREYVQRTRATVPSVLPSFQTVGDWPLSSSFASSCAFRLRSVLQPLAWIKAFMPPDACRRRDCPPACKPAPAL